MQRGRFAIAVAAAVAIILSAPYVQQIFSAVEAAWPAQVETIGRAATVIPVGTALLVALVRIRDRRPSRYVTLLSSLLIGAAYVSANPLAFTETFHFVEYGLFAWLFYRAITWRDAPSVLLLTLFAGVIVGTLDEWFQWFIPLRAGEARDILVNAVATTCGLLFALSVEPPNEGVSLRRASLPQLGLALSAALILVAAFFLTVHVGYDVHDPDIGSFRSRYTAGELRSLARDRRDRWREEPPQLDRRLGREDQYLAEGLWHVRQRNDAWGKGDFVTAWRENRILEKFYGPVLDTPVFAAEHRWGDAQRSAAEQTGAAKARLASDAYPYPLYVWRSAR
jgi:VanZ family protein